MADQRCRVVRHGRAKGAKSRVPRYIARMTEVNANLYSAWLRHYQAPICTSTDHRGQLCGEIIERVASPTEFHEGESDRCSQHQMLPHRLVAERR